MAYVTEDGVFRLGKRPVPEKYAQPYEVNGQLVIGNLRWEVRQINAQSSGRDVEMSLRCVLIGEVTPTASNTTTKTVETKSVEQQMKRVFRLEM